MLSMAMMSGKLFRNCEFEDGCSLRPQIADSPKLAGGQVEAILPITVAQRTHPPQGYPASM
jgi:hypothetical protein